MPVNNFEKQVQQKMDELQLRPSAEVWQEVEKRIRREKKRRWMVLFILLGVLLLGGTGWWIATADKKQPAGQSITETKNKKNTNKINPEEKKENETISLTEEKIENKQEDKKEIIKNNTTENTIVTDVKVATEKKATATVFQKNTINETSGMNTIVEVAVKKKKQQKDEVQEIPVVKKEQPLVEKKKNTTDVQVAADEVVTTIDINTAIKDSISIKDIATKNSTAGTEMIKDTAILKDVVENTTTAKNNPYPIVSDSSAKQPEAVAKKDYIKIKNSRWELGFTGVIGVSKRAEELSVFGSIMKQRADVYSSPGTGSGGSVLYLKPSASEKGNFWQLGMYAKRKFTTKTGLSAGLNFSSYSTIQATGTFVNSSTIINSGTPTNGFYASGATGTLHTNHYYYLQLPVSFHWQLNKGTKLPVTWQNGFSTGLFLGGDALVYNSQSNTFYKDNTSFNNFQLSYQSGLYVKLFNKLKHPFSAGVLFNYHFSQLQKTNIYGPNRLTSYGFQLGWLLKK